jgi:alkylation response protein AidB-like acyl-CoA dehydrogenase
MLVTPCRRYLLLRSTVLHHVQEFLGRREGLFCEPLLPMIAEQAAQADHTRSVDPAVIQAIKKTDIMRMSASLNIGGLESSVTAMAQELEAVASCCASTAWCLWNHLCVFHFI